jgi:hypothetical protein
VNILWSALIVAAASGAAVIVLLLIRRNAPDGSYFHDGDRASGVLGVSATGFSLVLGFSVFPAFTSFDNSRSGPRRCPLRLPGTSGSAGQCGVAMPVVAPINSAGKTGPSRKLESDTA